MSSWEERQANKPRPITATFEDSWPCYQGHDWDRNLSPFGGTLLTCRRCQHQTRAQPGMLAIADEGDGTSADF